MQKLTFAEIRYRYKEKYEKRLSGDNAVLKKKLGGYRIYQDGQYYFLEVQDKQKECERIVDSLNIQNRALHEQDVIKKYHLLLQTLPESYQQMFPDTLQYHNGYITYLINHRKNKRTQMVHSFKSLKTMLQTLIEMVQDMSRYQDAAKTVKVMQRDYVNKIEELECIIKEKDKKIKELFEQMNRLTIDSENPNTRKEKGIKGNIVEFTPQNIEEFKSRAEKLLL